MRKTAAVIAAAFVALLATVPAFAQADQETILIDVFLTREGEVGEIVFVRDVPVEPALVGATCTATARTENNTSEHPNNDFLLTSGGVTAVIPDFERHAGAIVSMTTPLVLGDTISASIRLGGDHVTSEGVLVTLLCASQPEPTTTTQPPPGDTTTTTEPHQDTTTTQPGEDTTPTTEAPPVGGVQAGGGSTASPAVPAAPFVGGGALLLAAGLAMLALARQRSDTDRG